MNLVWLVSVPEHDSNEPSFGLGIQGRSVLAGVVRKDHGGPVQANLEVVSEHLVSVVKIKLSWRKWCVVLVRSNWSSDGSGAHPARHCAFCGPPIDSVHPRRRSRQ